MRPPARGARDPVQNQPMRPPAPRSSFADLMMIHVVHCHPNDDATASHQPFTATSGLTLLGVSSGLRQGHFRGVARAKARGGSWGGPGQGAGQSHGRSRGGAVRARVPAEGRDRIAYNSCRNRHCPPARPRPAPAGSSAKRSRCCRSNTSTSSSRCRRRSPNSHWPTGRRCTNCCSKLRRRRCAKSRPTRSGSARRSAS